MTSVLWNIEHPMYAWDEQVSCFITSYEEEDIGEVEFHRPPTLAHWHSSCPQELKAIEQPVFTVNNSEPPRSLNVSLTTGQKKRFLNTTRKFQKPSWPSRDDGKTSIASGAQHEANPRIEWMAFGLSLIHI
eukprot:3147520-Prorocentrum_lima.AAC.1